MSTIIDRINSINQGVQDVKADFKTALENKGVEVADTLKLKDYPNLINEIKGSVTENIDLTNLTPENIRAGVTINGVTGTLVEQWDVVISPNRPENPRNGTIWIRDLSDESNNESGDDSGGGDSGGNNTGGSDSGDEPESSLTKVEVYAEYLENPVEGLYFNGTYTIQDQTKSGKEAVYVNEANGTELYWVGGAGCWSMRPIGVGYAYIYMYNHSGNDPWEVVGTGTEWNNDMQIPGGRFPAGTVTLVTEGGGSEGGGDTGGDSNIKLVVSNAGSSNVNGVYTQYTGSDYIAYKNESTDIYLWLNPNYLDRASWIFSPSINYPETSGWLYGATDNGSQSPIGLGFYRFGGSGDMPIVELYQDGGDSGGGTSNADYIVSNASNSLADGEYYLTTEIFRDYPVYKNANGYVIYMTSGYGWCIAPAVGQAPTHGAQGNFDSVPPTTGWYGDVTVTKG